MVINAVFRNLLFITLFRYILADDNLLEKSFGKPRKHHYLNNISQLPAFSQADRTYYVVQVLQLGKL